EIVYFMKLQYTGYFSATAAIGKCFHHCHQLSAGLQMALVYFYIVHHRSKVYFQQCLVYFLLQELHYFFKAKATGTFYQYYFIPEPGRQNPADKIAGTGKEFYLQTAGISSS